MYYRLYSVKRCLVKFWISLLEHSQNFVSVPPRWTIEPSDANIAASQEAVIHCQSDGYPKPVVTWKKAVGRFRTFSHNFAQLK